MFLNRLFKKNINNPDYESTMLQKSKVSHLNKSVRLLIIADTHGDLALSKTLKYSIIDKKFDLCCVLGDIHDYDYRLILEYIPKDKIVALLGNHDRFDLLKTYGLKDLNGKVVEVNGVKIGGVQGSFKYKDQEFPSFTHEQSIEFMEKMPYVDILLSHDKPFTYDYNDGAHDGLKGITKFLYERQVPINIHGHLHTSDLKTLKNGTQVKGVYEVELIEIKDGKVEVLK